MRATQSRIRKNSVITDKQRVANNPSAAKAKPRARIRSFDDDDDDDDDDDHLAPADTDLADPSSSPQRRPRRTTRKPRRHADDDDYVWPDLDFELDE